MCFRDGHDPNLTGIPPAEAADSLNLFKDFGKSFDYYLFQARKTPPDSGELKIYSFVPETASRYPPATFFLRGNRRPEKRVFRASQDAELTKNMSVAELILAENIANLHSFRPRAACPASRLRRTIITAPEDLRLPVELSTPFNWLPQ